MCERAYTPIARLDQRNRFLGAKQRRAGALPIELLELLAPLQPVRVWLLVQPSRTQEAEVATSQHFHQTVIEAREGLQHIVRGGVF